MTQINLSKKRLMFIFGALVVITISVFIIAMLIGLVLGAVGAYFVIPFINDYLKNQKSNSEQQKLIKMTDKFTNEQKLALKKMLEGD